MTATEHAIAPIGNKGSSLPDVKAVQGQQSKDEWLKDRGIVQSEQVRLTKISHMRYQHPDLDALIAFLADFGMEIAKQTAEQVWFRGYGPDQYVYYAQKGHKKFLGGTFEVESFHDLEKAAQIPGAGKIQELKDAPGGGHLVTAYDAEGFPINFLYGQTPKTVEVHLENLILNSALEKPRVKRFQRFEEGPAAVHKLGHYGLVVRDFPSQMDWYTKHFNFVPSDLLFTTEGDGTKKDVSIFACIDKDTELVDHHTIFLSKGEKSHVHHCSFEVHDYDTQQLGHQWLAKKDYKSVWGVGRHILGSQIFDYWWDVSGNMVEHYSDGDLVDHSTPIGHLPVSLESLAVWGPDVPHDFLD